MHARFTGIVLFVRPHRENDGLVKIFTQEYGTKMFFVRGLNRPNNLLKSQLLPLTENDYVGIINDEGLSFLNEGITRTFFHQVQLDIVRQAFGVYFSQLVDASLEDNLPNPAVYKLLKRCLQALESGVQPEIVTAFLEIHLLPAFGTGLHWGSCVICQSTLEPYDMSIRKMGLLCSRHFSQDEFRLRIHPRAMHVVNLLAQVSIEQIESIQLKPETLEEVRRLMDEIYQEFVGIRLKSRHYLDQLAKMEASIAGISWKKSPENKD